MSENLKKFLEFIGKDSELLEKAKRLKTDDLEKAKEIAIAFAKENGFELTEADFEAPEGELSENELGAVAGGGACACVVGGGGTSGDREDDTCYCALVGMGAHDNLDENGNATSFYWRCYCVGAGGGTDDE